MRTELYFPNEASEARRDDVRAAFAEQEIALEREGRSALKSLEILDLRIDAAFILGSAVGGLLWDVEREALKRGIAALRKVWQVSGSVTLDASAEGEERVPTILLRAGRRRGGPLTRCY